MEKRIVITITPRDHVSPHFNDNYEEYVRLERAIKDVLEAGFSGLVSIHTKIE